jgi:hypothetical protein
MTPMNIRRLQTRYSGRFVALRKGAVIASAKTHAALVKKILPTIRTQRLELLFVPPKGLVCVY